MIVVDASALATALTDDGTDGQSARERLRGQVLAAPELVDLEVSSVARRLVLSGQLPLPRAEQALADLVVLPVQRAPHLPLLARCWALRDDLSVDDAAFVRPGRVARQRAPHRRRAAVQSPGPPVRRRGPAASQPG